MDFSYWLFKKKLLVTCLKAYGSGQVLQVTDRLTFSNRVQVCELSFSVDSCLEFEKKKNLTWSIILWCY